MRYALLLVCLLPCGLVAQGPPGSDIWIGALTVRDGRAQVGTLTNATARPGYDNQPAFLPDGSGFLFTTIGADAQADIARYDFTTRQVTAVTTTPESEYSPTLVAGTRGVSVVRVEPDSTQRLWRFAPPDPPKLLLERLKPVGYQAWTDPGTLVAFVLGQPNALVVVDMGTGRADTAARDIGRSLQPVPGGRAVSFVQRVDSSESWLAQVDTDTRATRRLVRLPPGAEFHVWLPGGAVLASDGAALHQWSGSEGAGWTVVADLGALGLRGVTRLAVSARGDRIAIVARDPQP